MIIVSVKINSEIEKVWKYWTEPAHIQQWTFASDDWHVPFAENNLIVGGNFKTTMAAKDESFSFDFEGIYTFIIENSKIEYVLGDGRKVIIIFELKNNLIEITESFEPETENSEELQKNGWQAILENFKKYIEKN